ncbi:MAG: ribonuclease P protein component [Ignavibacteria bacterium GWA2_35_9]|nr:MAG: ribonuclease P protein component [Ignavibacteria bacterium GWA2_35_9]OGU48657.1 MAG: ribonuclease P protein component [Ignavibacteria bacterium GWB2_36_8]OGU51604.1 MAG: ribonuclease P protein component [Ignavibacteria bacterium GWC2_36_12]OGV00892.1 MAG: ribonuclease P protein component [Ignavibacteria bacterium RIFOXYB2_FULL_36_7]
MKRYGLSPKERIKSKKNIDQIFSSGKILISEDHRIKAVYLIDKEAEESGVKIAAVVSKKNGNAVWRNRVKRLIKTSYRLNKERLVNFCRKKRILILIVFSAFSVTERLNKKIEIKDIMPGIDEILNRIESSA